MSRVSLKKIDARILNALSEIGPMPGIEIQRSVYGHWWAWHTGKVFAALSRLRSLGWIVESSAVDGTHQGRRVYELSPEVAPWLKA